MLTQEQANIFALKNQTIVDNILKEHYQMFILDILYRSSFESKLIFKGGTALRLAYNSMRFSEDLDFSILTDIPYKDFEKTIKSIEKIIPEAKIKDLHDKRFTLFAKIVFKVSYKPIPIGIKVEINKDTKDFKEQITLLKSPFSNMEVLGRVFTLESILKDKLTLIEPDSRRDPRDLFDAWFINQRLNQEFIIKDDYKYNQKELMNGLNPLLPQNYKKVMELFKI
jgi:predicted nucleotidyltransferase component of viral defense system